LLGIKKKKKNWLGLKIFFENVHLKNSYVLIWVEIVPKNITTFFKLTIFSMCSNQVELAVLTLFISTTKLLVQSVVSTYLSKSC